MSLSCSCPDWDEVDGFGYYEPSDYSTYPEFKRGKRCSSCQQVVLNSGDLCTKFQRFRYPRTEIEEKIYGEGNQIPLADWYMCEACSDQFFNLEALGFCVVLGDNMMELLEEYKEMVKEVKNNG